MATPNTRGKTSQILKVTIEPGGKATRPAFGSYMYVVECSAPFLWKMDQSPIVPADQGSRMECTESATYETVEFVNPNLSEITVKVFVGFVKYDQSRFALIEPPTSARGESGSLAATTTLVLDSALEPGEVRRKALLISNGSAADRLHIRDADLNVIQFIFPSSSVIVPISQGVTLYNPNAGAVDYAIGEIFWLTAT